MIRVASIGKRFGGTEVLRDVSFEVSRGECFGVIGPNGSGKTTLLTLLSGLDTPSGGEAVMNGRPVLGYKRKELARWLAVLQQDAMPPTGFTVKEVVAMGRYPFQNWLGGETAEPIGLVESVLDCMGLTALADRPVESLSGGERQRVALAKAMAQQPKVLLLDEPTTFLDIGYQIQLMDLIRAWQRDSELTVVAVLHDLNLAAMYCDRLLLLHEGKAVCVGKPSQVITAPLIQSVYGAEARVLMHPSNGAPQILLESGLAPRTFPKASGIMNEHV